MDSNIFNIENPAFQIETSNNQTTIENPHHNCETENIPQINSITPYQYNNNNNNDNICNNNDDDDDDDADDDNGLKRESWSDQADFIFNTIGYVVGLGNFWKFPQYIVKYHGSFLISYTMIFLLFGIPTFLFEMYIGQFTTRGPILSWGQCKLLRGIGFAYVIKNVIDLPSYAMVIVWAFKYIILSFNPRRYFLNSNSKDNETIDTRSYFNSDGFGIGQVTDGLANFGLPKWELILANILTWTIIFLCVMHGIKYSGKIIYVTVIVPTFLLVILLTHVLTLKGANQGIIENFNKIDMANTQMWIDSATQVLFSLSLASSGINTLASFRKFRDEMICTAFLVCFIDYITSIIGSIIITGFLGSLSYGGKHTLDLKNSTGFDLLFVIVPQAMLEHDITMAVLWLLILFTIMLTLAFDTAVTKLRIQICGYFEIFGFPKRENTIFYYLGFSIIGFIFCIPMCCPGGLYWNIQIEHGLSWCFILMELLLFIFVIVFYGFKNVYHDIEFMVDNYPRTKIVWKYMGWYFVICWSFIVPITLLVLFIVNFTPYTFYTISNIVVPAWMRFFEIFFPLCLIFSFLVYCLYFIIKSKLKSISMKFKSLIAENGTIPLWLPVLIDDRENLEIFKKDKSKGNIIDHFDAI